MQTINFRIIHTSDIHGCFFPYDFIHRKKATGSLSRISTYVKEMRRRYGENLILLDSGDFMEGQPTCDYDKYFKPQKQNTAIEVANYMRYDCMTIGNHDVEMGNLIYDDFTKKISCPVLGANAVSIKDGESYFTPYHILKRQGIKIAVIGMVTPAIPYWLGEELWSGMMFTDILKATQELLKNIRENEKPDIIIGLFHSGWDGGLNAEGTKENCIKEIAEKLDGLDLILFGHDHIMHCEKLRRANGSEVVCLNPASDGKSISVADISINKQTGEKNISGNILSVESITIDNKFIDTFKEEIKRTKSYSENIIANIPFELRTSDCSFGVSAINSTIHRIQLDIMKADVSFTAPLAFDETVGNGEVRFCDIYRLYRYDNSIYMIRMSGKEIKDYLEMSYDLWINTMHTPDDHLMKTISYEYDNKKISFFKNLVFNFDTAAGIIYSVDVRERKGNRIKITSMSDGKPFKEENSYHVAMHSYRGNGGNELLTKGAGIKHTELKERLLSKSQHNIRFYLVEYLRNKPQDTLQQVENWTFQPECWTQKAIEREKRILFNR